MWGKEASGSGRSASGTRQDPLLALPGRVVGADAGTVTTSAPHPDRTRTHLTGPTDHGRRPVGGAALLLAAVSGTAAVSLLARLLGA